MSLTLLRANSIPGWTFEKRRDPSFNFLPDPHQYHLKGRRLWSPSGVFLEVRYVDDTYYDDESCYRGQYVHRATHLIDAGDPKIWDTLYAEGSKYLGFVEGYCEFKEIWKFKPRMRELSIYHPQYHYGVTPDGEGTILGDSDDALVEIKTGTMPWWVKYQLAAQDIAISAWDMAERFRRRFCVELKKNGKFRVKEFTGDEDHDHTWHANLKTCQSHYSEPPAKLTQALAY